jgi:hypothetical protein
MTKRNAKHAEVLSGATFHRANTERGAKTQSAVYRGSGHRTKVAQHGGKWGCWVWPKAKNPTIYQALATKLGRTPTNAELKTEVSRIKKEGADIGLLRKSKKRNPEAGAVAMREAFTGLPSDGTIIIARDERVHSNLAEIGPLIELRGKTINNEPFLIEFKRSTNPRRKSKDIISRAGGKTKGWLDRRAKAIAGITEGFSKTWINPRKRNGNQVLLCCNEDGSHLFIEGGDQSINLGTVGLSDLAKKEVATIGDVWYIVYHCRKRFAGEPEEEHDYEHKFSEDSDGPRPTLRYDVKNKHLYLDGGVYFIPRALFGASQGLTD